MNAPDKSNGVDSPKTNVTIKSTNSNAVADSIIKPENQVLFEGVISKYISAYKQAKNELQNVLYNFVEEALPELEKFEPIALSMKKA